MKYILICEDQEKETFILENKTDRYYLQDEIMNNKSFVVWNNNKLFGVMKVIGTGSVVDNFETDADAIYYIEKEFEQWN